MSYPPSPTIDETPYITAIQNRVTTQGKFSKLQGYYTEGILPTNFPQLTGLPLNILEPANVKCSACVFFQPNTTDPKASKCSAVGLPSDLIAADTISPDGLSAAFVAKVPTVVTDYLTRAYIRFLPGIVLPPGV